MKRVVISQRRDDIAGRDETRDALDVRLGAILWQMGFLPIPLCSSVDDPIAYAAALDFDAVLLSGGPDIGTAPERDAVECAMLDFALREHRPVLGICRGLQLINHILGGTLVRRPGHVATRHRVRDAFGRGWQTEVNSYHNYCLTHDTLAPGLMALALADDGTIEAARHEKHPWLGILWHPERDAIVSQSDFELIHNHLNGDYSWQEPSSLPLAWERACDR